MTQFKALKLQEKLKSKIFVDQFEKLFYLSDIRLKNTVWFGPMEANHTLESQQCMIKKQFGPKIAGLIKNMRFKCGNKLQVKTTTKNVYMFVEFENEKDSNRVQTLLRKRKLNVSKKAYLAGSNTFIANKRSKRK